MPVQKGKALDILKKGGAEKDFDAHKDDETELGFGGDLPAGVTGVAQLVQAKLDVYKSGANAGKPYLLMRGTVIKPEEHKGVPVAGLSAMIMVPLCDDPKGFAKRKTRKDRIAEALNEMRKMGIDTAGLSLDDWEEKLEELVEEAPHFRFNTRATINPTTKKEARVKTYFNGIVGFEGNGEAAVDEAVDDDSAGGDEGEGDEAGTGDEGEEQDWDALGEAADNSDDDAIETLKNACEEHGIDPDAIDSWAEVATAIQEAIAGGDGEGDEGEGDEEAPEFETGEVKSYKPKGAAKAVKVKIVKIDAGNRKADVQEVSGAKKVHKGVKFDQLK